MNGQQLEMRFDSQFRPLIRRQRRSTRARWWFAQMRQVVDRAWDWGSAQPARPRQVLIPSSQSPGQN